MNELYTANTLLIALTMIIMMVGLHYDISLSKRRRVLCTHLYAAILFCAVCEWLSTCLEGADSSLVPVHIVLKVLEQSFSPLIGIFAGGIIHRHKKLPVHMLLVLFSLQAVANTISAFNGIIFTVDAANHYQYGPYHWIYPLTYLLGCAFFCYQVFITFREYKFMGGKQLLMVAGFVVAGLLTNLFFPHSNIEWLTISMGSLMMIKFSGEMLLQTDGLTQLVNRMGYEHYLPRLRTPATFVIFDVDLFKDVNDQFGHQAGDECLRDVADCIRQTYSPFGTCFRIGGDEFCVAVTHRSAKVDIMNRIFYHNLAQKRQEKPILPTVSLGYAHYDPSVDNMQDVISRADSRMYEYKESHR